MQLQALPAPPALAPDGSAAIGAAPTVDCAVVVVTYNSAADIERLLDSVPAAAGDLTVRTIVVDNGSSDDTVQVVRRRRDVECIETGANLGYAGAINVGRAHAGGARSICVLNPDLSLEPLAIARLFAALDDPGVGMVVPTMLDETGELYCSLRREPSILQAIGDALFGRHLAGRPGWLSEIVRDPAAYRRRHPIDWAGGAALLISARCDAVVGHWDDRFFLYSEETDFASRVWDARLRVELVPEAVVRHRGEGSGTSPELVALMAVNRVRYYENRHGVVATGAFRLAVALHEALRSTNHGHRVALARVLRRSSWASLPGARSGARRP